MPNVCLFTWFRLIAEDPKDLIRKCLVVDPSQRITVKEVLRHPFFNQMVSAGIVGSRRAPITTTTTTTTTTTACTRGKSVKLVQLVAKNEVRLRVVFCARAAVYSFRVPVLVHRY